MLLAAEGLSNEVIAERLGVGRVQVGRWRSRYAEGGLQAIEKEPRTSCRREFAPTRNQVPNRMKHCTGGFQGGLNTLDSRVHNDSNPQLNPTGLRVEISGTANALAAVQEPDDRVPLGAGLAGMAIASRSRRV